MIRPHLTILFLAIASIAGGCAKWDVHGTGFNDTSTQWGEKLRPPSPAGQSTGVDTKAKEIERNLGVR